MSTRLTGSWNRNCKENGLLRRETFRHKARFDRDPPLQMWMPRQMSILNRDWTHVQGN